MKLTFERDHDPLAEPAHLLHDLPRRLGKRGRHRAQKERTREASAFKPCAENPRGKVLHVHDYVRKLGHAGRIIAPVGGPPAKVR